MKVRWGGWSLWAKLRFRGRRGQLITFEALLPHSQGRNLALTVVHEPYSLGSGLSGNKPHEGIAGVTLHKPRPTRMSCVKSLRLCLHGVSHRSLWAGVALYVRTVCAIFARKRSAAWTPYEERESEGEREREILCV